MRLFATFANRGYDPEVIELVDAWDEFQVDENPDGFHKSRQAALDSWGDDLFRWVTVEIDVEDAGIYAALEPVSVSTAGTVTTTGVSS